MDPGAFIAYPTLALTIGLAVLRPPIGIRGWRFTPGSAAVLGVAVLLATGMLSLRDLAAAAQIQWRPLLALTCIMVMTGLVQEAGVFDRMAGWLEARGRTRSATHSFTVVFVMSAITAALLNNDAAILILTPLSVAFARRLFPDDARLVMPFAFAVFLAPGVAPFIVSNPMNMIVASFAGLDFNAYAAIMLPISAVGAVVTYLVLRAAYRKVLRSARVDPRMTPRAVARRPGQIAATLLLLAVFAAYPIGAALGIELWFVAIAGAVAALVLARAADIAPVRKVAAHVSIDVLLFLWGIFLVVQSLRHVGVVDWLHTVYATAAPGGAQLTAIGVTSAIGSALVDNHPMAMLNMLAIDTTSGARPLLAALVGGDIGPRLLPIGSLAGLLWIDLLRRNGVDIGIGRFVRIGTLVLIPTLAVSLILLWLI